MTPVLLTERPPALLVPAPIEDATRREFITGVGAAALAAAFLAACGEDDAGGESTTPAMRDVVDAYGNTVTIPSTPERIVVADNALLPWVMSLGIVPVAAGSIGPDYNEGKDYPPPLYDLGADAITVISRNEPDYELVATLNPDLVIAATFALEGRIADQGEGYRRLAPVVAVDGSVGPLETFRAVAAILGREDEAQTLIGDFESAIRASAAGSGAASMSLVTPGSDGGLNVWTVEEPLTATLSALVGIPVVPGPEVDYGSALPGEQVKIASGDALIVLSRPGVGLDDNPLYPLLPAVQAGQVHDAGSYLIYSGGWGLGPLQEQLIGIARFLASVE